MKSSRVLVLIAAIILYIGRSPLSYYDFYIWLRWAICGISLYIAYCRYKDKKFLL